MYSGSDSNESQKFPQWALNPATYQNLSNEQVDWAALAQQWIIMKESGPPPIPGEQPVIIKKPPEKISPVEALVEGTCPPAPIWNISEPPPAPGSETWGNYSQNPNWNWNNTWVQPTVVPPPSINVVKPALLPTPSNSFSAPPESNSDNAVPFGSYNTSSTNEGNHSSYWTSSSGQKHIKPHNKRYSKVNVPIRATAPLPPVVADPEPIVVAPMPSLDANKRKQLPAWIREGLEKMEKDKLRQMEKEKQNQEREENIEKNKQSDKETMEILKSTMKERIKSRFDSDEESSVEESKPQRRQSSPEPIPLTQDELMLKVRRTMTEILLSVTNRHIEAVCREELQRFAKKRKASDQRWSAPSGANISSRLGLGMYADDSASGTEEDEPEDVDQHDSLDSDDDLKDTIKRRMSEFQKTERAIEDRLDEVERRRTEGATRSPSPESDDNDSQVDARSQGADRQQDDSLDIPLPESDTPKKKAGSPSASSNQKARSPSVSSKQKARSASASSEASERGEARSRRSSSSEDAYRKGKNKGRSRRSNSSEKRLRSRSPSPPKRRDSKRDSNGSRRRDSTGSKKKSSSRRSRSRSSSYKKSRRSRDRSRSRNRSRRSKSSRSRSRSRYSKRSPSSSRYSKRSPSSSRSERRSRGDRRSRGERRKRSRSASSGRGKRSHRR
ncbi:unnamed protein product [Phaedon cochleariae]|uniref:Arginine/serine-rich protein PNISR-like n=1 Tax=Phaedon cochleariae TaxID=80249 RepID=A0A9N9SKK5_PHACE|nr:unnamed protein product [Phaedon cochleariae]